MAGSAQAARAAGLVACCKEPPVAVPPADADHGWGQLSVCPRCARGAWPMALGSRPTSLPVCLADCPWLGPRATSWLASGGGGLRIGSAGSGRGYGRCRRGRSHRLHRKRFGGQGSHGRVHEVFPDRGGDACTEHSPVVGAGHSPVVGAGHVDVGELAALEGPVDDAPGVTHPHGGAALGGVTDEPGVVWAVRGAGLAR